jgi:response regulator RpfG family c-di-GMP phosphodiesterase
MASAPTLLLVDDEERILSALKRVLRREGYRIVTARGGDEALRALDVEPVDLVVSDHKMPGMNGLDLLAAVAERRPGTARILVTGWPEEVPAGRMRALGIAALIPKPWDDGELKQALRRALGRG